MATPPPTLDDVNKLVIETTALIGATEIPGTTKRRPVAAITISQPRFIPVLEAIASLAVCKGDTQVVAASVIASDSELIFTLAENDVVPDRVMNHIRELLGCLKAYSTATDEGMATIKLDILKNTYMHSYSKLNKRFKNRAINTLEIAFADVISDLGSSALLTGSLEVISALTTSHVMLVDMAAWFKTVKLPQKPKGNTRLLPVDQRWKDLITEIDQVNLDMQDVLKNEMKCEEWAKKLEGHGGLPSSLPLFRWVQKLSSHHRQINNLLRYAESPEGRRDLSLVDGPLCQRSVVANIPTRPPAGTVHCECALISNLAEPMVQPNRPVNYIGVSKLSCAACYAWIDAYNETANLKFYTQGTHGRWYPGWTMSTVWQPQNLLDRMMVIVGDAKKKYQDEVEKSRRILVTDSTGAEVQFVPGLPPRTKVYLSAASRQARRPKS